MQITVVLSRRDRGGGEREEEKLETSRGRVEAEAEERKMGCGFVEETVGKRRVEIHT